MSQQRKVVYILIVGFVALCCVGLILFFVINMIQYRVDKNREAAIIQKTVLMFSSSFLLEMEKYGTNRADIALNSLLDMSIVGAWNNKYCLNNKELMEIQAYISRAFKYRKMKPRVLSNDKNLSLIQIQADNILSNIVGVKVGVSNGLPGKVEKNSTEN